MIYTITAVAFVLVFASIGAMIWWSERSATHGTGGVVVDRAGWVYFAAAEGDELPVKIGMTRHEPSVSRIPDLSTMSPVPLKIVFKAFVPDRYAVEAALHRELGPYRLHGEWFDRDAALAWADHLKGAW